VVVIVHQNGHNVDHNLSNDDVGKHHLAESQHETVVLDQVLERLFRQNDLLFVQHEPIKVDNAASEQGIAEVGELVLVVSQDVRCQQSKEDVQQQDQRASLDESVRNEVLNGPLNDSHLWQVEHRVVQKGDSPQHNDDSVEVLAELVEVVEL